MARPRSFDMDDILAKSMRLFWRKGYGGTSMSDVYEATGLKPGSLYAAFGDKEGLFRQAFDHYAGHFRATLPKDVRGVAAIEAWLRLQARLAADDKERAGCLIVNTVAEREAHSPATQAAAAGRLGEIRDFFRDNLRIAADAGEIDPGLDREVRADALTGAVVAIMTLGRGGADRTVIDNVAEAAIKGIK